MPQSICTLCADKINDFFEYREMCGATNIQTRKLLGIPLEVAKRKKLTNDKVNILIVEMNGVNTVAYLPIYEKNRKLRRKVKVY